MILLGSFEYENNDKEVENERTEMNVMEKQREAYLDGKDQYRINDPLKYCQYR